MSEQQIVGTIEPVQTLPPVETVQQDAPEGDESQQPAGQASEVEEIAREMGWAPETEWKGPKEAWKTAKEFIRHGTVIQRELKNRNDTQQRDFEQRLERMDRANKQALKNQRDNIVAQYDVRKREAVTVGDMQAYDAANRAEAEALKNFDAEVEDAPPQQQGGPGKAPPEVVDFAMRNSDWFDKDPIMTGAALALNSQIGRDHPHLSVAEKLRLVENEIKRRFGTGSSSQQNGDGGHRQQVEGGLRPIKTTKTKGWAELPAEARQVATRQIKEGLFKSQDEYAKSYWEQE